MKLKFNLTVNFIVSLGLLAWASIYTYNYTME